LLGSVLVLPRLGVSAAKQEFVLEILFRMIRRDLPACRVPCQSPSKPEAQGKGFRVNGRNFATINTSLDDLIEFAYDVHAKQIIGGPEWLDKDKYDLAAVPDKEGSPSYEQWKSMVQKLLTDRFKLTFHHDKQERLPAAQKPQNSSSSRFAQTSRFLRAPV
jgi:Protein of unknown function (DUF3738)